MARLVQLYCCPLAASQRAANQIRACQLLGNPGHWHTVNSRTCWLRYSSCCVRCVRSCSVARRPLPTAQAGLSFHSLPLCTSFVGRDSRLEKKIFF